MNIIICYVSEVDNKHLGYMFDNQMFRTVNQLTPDIIENVENMYFKRSLGHFVRKANIPEGTIKKVSVGVNMPKTEYMMLPVELVQYVQNLAKQYKPVTRVSETISMDNLANNYNIGNTNGWDMINICRDLRRAVRENALVIDIDAHTANGGRNVQLFEFIRACNYDVTEFISNYISGIQPCMLRQVKKNLAVADCVCVSDVFYKFDILIKYKKEKNGKRFIVSFHESNISGNMTSAVASKMVDKEYSAILTDGSYCMSDLSKYATYRFSVSRGFVRWQLEAKGNLIQPDLIVLDTDVIIHELNEYMSSTLLYLMVESGVDEDYIDNLFRRYSVNFSDYTITAFGGGVLNNLSLLLEVVPRVKNDRVMYNKLCEVFMTLFTLYLPSNQWSNVLGLLQRRYFLDEKGHGNNTMLRALVDIGKYLQGGGKNV